MSDQAVYMFNALWFKKDGGAKNYNKYLAAAHEVSEKLGIGVKMHKGFVPTEMLIGEWDPDLFFIAEYRDRETFNIFVNSKEFLAIKPLREDAIEKSLLIQCDSFR